jgi:hypothetical protein
MIVHSCADGLPSMADATSASVSVPWVRPVGE